MRFLNGFEEHLRSKGLEARGGQIIDDTLVPVSKQRNSREENKAIKDGAIPEKWLDKPYRLRRKDLVRRQRRVGIYPSQKLLDWARQLELDVDVAGARETCLYLIPDYETDEEADEILEEAYEAIFEAELDYWHRDSGTWPAERTYAVFRKWFDVRLYPLIQDLVSEELTATEVDEEFLGKLRTELQGLEPRS